jgi:CheY-like chemotaxis protein/anti-sigma regulatory factor (Ser/Thr protein kinase)
MSQQPVTPAQLATLSHEFRTPLNGVLGMARLLDGTRLTAEQKSYVAALRESGEHLLGLVNDVLDFARLGEGRVEVHATAFEIEDLLRQVAELMSPRAHEKGLEIAWAVEPGLATVIADEGRLRQVLLNFAGNAVKFTAEGGLLLSATRTGQGRLRLSVRDTGPGVSPEARERIFRPFEQANPAEDWKHGGAGLGLAIVSRLAQAMDGAVGIGDADWEGPKNTMGAGGAEFWFEAELEAPQGGDRSLAGLTVAIASPCAVVRAAAAMQVEASGGRALVGADIDVALAKAPTDCVILIDQDLARPGKTLRPPPGHRAIVLLKPEERGAIARRRASGFVGYLIKPLRRASVAEQVRLALTAARPEAAPKDDDRISGASAQGMRILLAEDNPINALLARTLLEREGAKVDRAASGEEALAALSAQVYDLILMDLRMPGLNGIEATRALRQRGVATPVVALTADAFDDDRRTCMAAGMNDFLVKPLTPDALRSALIRWTRTAREAKLAS